MSTLPPDTPGDGDTDRILRWTDPIARMLLDDSGAAADDDHPAGRIVLTDLPPE